MKSLCDSRAPTLLGAPIHFYLFFRVDAIPLDQGSQTATEQIKEIKNSADFGGVFTSKLRHRTNGTLLFSLTSGWKCEI